jgi:TrmH family RNA methyltransferase
VSDRAFITSPSNQLVRRARKLRHRKHRDEQGAFLVEGIQPVWQAVEQGAPIEVLLVCRDLLTSEAAAQMVGRASAAGVPVADLSAGAFAAIAERQNPSGVAAIVRAEPAPLSRLDASAESLLVALDEVGNPGNLGSIIRTVDAVGGNGVVVIGEATDAWHPAAVKASMGTIFNVALHEAATVDEVFDWCAVNRVSVVTTSAHAETDFRDATYSSPTLVLFGSEAHGLSDDILHRGAPSVRIPMAGSASSLNLAVAAGVLLYEIKQKLKDSSGAREWRTEEA